MNPSNAGKKWTHTGLKEVRASSNSRLTLLVAPAGSGKTRLLRLWAEELRAREEPVAWLSLVFEDNNPGRFWADLFEALKAIYPLDLPAQTEDMEAAIISLINDLAGLPAKLVLILDDYHVITNEAVHQAIRLILDYPPSNPQLVIASRSEPPLQIPRLRARRQLNEVRCEIEEEL